MKMGRVDMRKALEAYAHCCTEAEIREIVSNLTEEDQERLQTHGHIFLVRALRSNKESTAVVSALLDQPSEIPLNLSDTDGDGNTVFLVAVQVRDHKVVQLLLEKRLDSDPNAANRITGNTALHETAKSADCLEILVTLLGDRRVNVNVVNNDKQTPLHVASLSRDQSNLEVFCKIVDAARDTVRSLPQFLGSVDHHGRTALHYLSESGNAEAVAVILEAAGDGAQELALARDNKGHVAIHLAIQTRQSSIVDLLLRFGDCEDGDGYRMIHHAVQSDCNLDMVEKRLYEHPTLKNNHSRDAVTAATQSLVVDLYLELLKVTTNPNIARFLLTNLDENHVARWTDISSHWPPPHPGRLLLWAIQSGADHSALLIEQVLIWLPDEAGAHLNPTTRRTALHISVLYQNVEAVKALCSETGQLHIRGDACDYWNKTALDYAFDEPDVSIQRMLREHRDVKLEYEKMERSSEKYVTAANTILVGSALVVALTYSHCLSSYEVAKLKKEIQDLGLPDLMDKKFQIVDFIVDARLAFFLAVTTTVMAAFAALPFSVTDFFQQAVDDRHVKALLRRKSKLVMGASYFLVQSLGAVLFSFICSQLIAPYIEYNCDTACRIALAVYTILSLVWLVRNSVQLWKHRMDTHKYSPVKQQVELKRVKVTS